MITSLLSEICNINYGTRVVRSRDQGSKYDVYGGGGKTFKLDSWNREDSMVVSRFGMSPLSVRFVAGRFFLNDSGLTVSVKDESAIDPGYINWFLLFANDQIFSLGRGSAQRNLDVKAFGSLKVIFPESLNAQRQIAKKFDTAFEKIDKAIELVKLSESKAKTLYDETFRNIFLNLTNVKQLKISDICETGAGGTPNKSYPEYYVNPTVPWLRSGEVSRKYIYNAEMSISTLGLKNSSAKLFPENSVLVAMYGATAGQVAILKFKSSTNQAVCAILPHKDILPEYMYYAVLSRKKELLSQAVGNAQPNISQIKIKNLMIPYIQRPEQARVVAEIEALEGRVIALKDKFLKKTTMLTALRRSMLHEAFSESAVK